MSTSGKRIFISLIGILEIPLIGIAVYFTMGFLSNTWLPEHLLSYAAGLLLMMISYRIISLNFDVSGRERWIFKSLIPSLAAGAAFGVITFSALPDDDLLASVFLMVVCITEWAFCILSAVYELIKANMIKKQRCHIKAESYKT